MPAESESSRKKRKKRGGFFRLEYVSKGGNTEELNSSE